MSYEYLSDGELIHEIGVLEKLTAALADQAEKLARLRAEGKVSEAVYREVFEDLRKKAEVTARKRDELIAAADGRARQMDGEGTQLRHQLELLEVRHAIGAVPDEKYKVAHEGFMTQLAEIEEIKKKIGELINIITESSKKITQFVPATGMARPRDVAPVPTQAVAQPSIKPVERAPVVSTPAVAVPVSSTATPTVQPKAEPKPAEAKPEGQKPKVKKCSRCAAENLESAAYCYNCGAKL